LWAWSVDMGTFLPGDVLPDRGAPVVGC
jgi:hypothetical protein